MNFKLNYEGFEEYMIDDKPFERIEGARYVFKFENGLGASIIKNKATFGYSEDLWELATIKFFDGDDWELCHIQGFTDVVQGYLTDNSVQEILGIIRSIKNYD